MIILKKIFPYSIREYLKIVILPCFGVSLLATLLPIALHYTIDESFIRLILVAVAGVGCVIVSSFYIALNEIEKEMIVGFIRKKKKK